MFALIIDAVGAYLLTQRITKWLYLVPLAVIVGIISTVSANLVLHYLWPNLLSKQEVVLRIFQGVIYHPLFCLLFMWLFRRKQGKSSIISQKNSLSLIKRFSSAANSSKIRMVLFLMICGIVVFVVYMAFYQPKGYSNCIIDRMKGIQNDTAAKLIHKSCQKDYLLKEDIEVTDLKTWPEQQKNYDQCILEVLRDTRSKVAEDYIRNACRKKFPRKPFQSTSEKLPVENKNLLSGNISINQAGSFFISGKIYNENSNWKVEELILVVGDKNSHATLSNTYPMAVTFIPYVQSKYAIIDIDHAEALPTPVNFINNGVSETEDFDSLGVMYVDYYRKYLEASEMPSWICSALPYAIQSELFQGFVYRKDFIENYESANFWWTDKGQTKETFMVMLDRNIKNSMSISQYETLSLLDPKKYPSLDVGKSPTLQFYKLKIDIPPKANGSFSIFSSWPNDKTYEWVIYEARGRKL